MANLSSAFGEVTISSPNIYVIDALLMLIDREVGHCAYYTDIDSECISFEQTDENNIKTFKFTGVGRWQFSSNINCFYDWVLLSLDKEERNIVDDVLFLKLKQNDWSINFDFVDEESGCSVLYKSSITIEHNKTQDLNSITVFTHSEEDYDYNVVNLIKLCDYDLDSCEWLIDHLIDEDVNNISEITSYLGDLEDLMYELNLKDIDELICRFSECGTVWEKLGKKLEQLLKKGD